MNSDNVDLHVRHRFMVEQAQHWAICTKMSRWSG